MTESTAYTLIQTVGRIAKARSIMMDLSAVDISDEAVKKLTKAAEILDESSVQLIPNWNPVDDLITETQCMIAQIPGSVETPHGTIAQAQIALEHARILLRPYIR